MARDWRCRLSFHWYGPKRNDAREVYWECTRCGQMKFTNPPTGEDIAGGAAGW